MEKYTEGILRLKKFAERAERGEELTLGFFGGSITQGSLASEPETCYAYRVFDWWQKKYPNAVFHYVNAGIGGTSSHFGVSRVHRDLLMYRPDFVVVDFSVNDEPDEFFQETYEGLLRNIWYSDTKPAVILLNNCFYDSGKTAQEFHNAVGDHYQIPHVSVKEEIYSMLTEGKYTQEELSPDGLHPNDLGHQLLAEKIAGTIEKILEGGKTPELSGGPSEAEKGKENPEKIACYTQNAYEKAVRLTIENGTPELLGFRADAEEKTGHLDFFKNGWVGRRKGDRLKLVAEGSCIAVQYRKTIHKPSPVARLILDGDTGNAVVLDGNFEETWGDCLYIEPVLHHGEKGTHTIEIEIMEATEEDKAPFYLLSFIVA
ncbi:MAG: SGNH/GDSL hydrolase family protein [Lachnospiraceae bacterium]|nr:SGNH/GDSL hydrolase family protein [Lachnospiraceae bacterium]